MIPRLRCGPARPLEAEWARTEELLRHSSAPTTGFGSADVFALRYGAADGIMPSNVDVS